jgi:hypothetical protein
MGCVTALAWILFVESCLCNGDLMWGLLRRHLRCTDTTCCTADTYHCNRTLPTAAYLPRAAPSLPAADTSVEQMKPEPINTMFFNELVAFFVVMRSYCVYQVLLTLSLHLICLTRPYNGQSLYNVDSSWIWKFWWWNNAEYWVGIWFIFRYIYIN